MRESSGEESDTSETMIHKPERVAGAAGRERRGRIAAGCALLAALVACSAGCVTHRRDLGQESTRVQSTRIESSSAPSVGWPVTIIVEGKTVGTWPTNANGDVAVNLKNYLPVLARKGVIQLTYHIRTPEGALEIREFTLTPQDLTVK